MNNLKISDIDIELINIITCANDTDLHSKYFSVVETLRVFFEISRTGYVKNFEEKWIGLDNKNICLVLNIFLRMANRFGKCDYAYINTLLWFFDGDYYQKFKVNIDLILPYDDFIQKIERLIKLESWVYNDIVSDESLSFSEIDLKIVHEHVGVVVISPNPYSIYTLSVLESLKNSNIKINKVIFKNLYSFNRLKQEFRVGDKRLIKKIWRKLILRSSENPSSGVHQKTINDYMQQLSIKKMDCRKWCKVHNISYETFDNINSMSCVEYVKASPSSIGVFTGGGYVSSDLISCFDIGVINCHMGILPHYRGMDVVQWPLLENSHNNIGVCTHLMVKSIDAGPIVHNIHLRDLTSFNLSSVRNYVEYVMPKSLVFSVASLLTGHMPKSQNLSEGRTYFRMHRLLEKKLTNQA